MVSLRVLDISNNDLREFPTQCIDTLSSLDTLKATDNCLEVFPAEFEHLAIRTLDFSNNAIYELPNSIRNVRLSI